MEAKDLMKLHRNCQKFQNQARRRQLERIWCKLQHNTQKRFQNFERPTLPTLIVNPDEGKRTVIIPFQPPHNQKHLCPIKIDVDQDGYKLQDSMLINAHESKETIEKISEILCNDFELPSGLLVPTLSASISEQVEEYRMFLEQKSECGQSFNTLVIIDIDITVGLLRIVDKLEWDLDNWQVDQIWPFCNDYIRELALSAEFGNALLVDIALQLYHLQRALLHSGYVHNTEGALVVDNIDIQSRLRPKTHQIIRSSTEHSLFTTTIIELHASEVEKLSMDRSRVSRRKRRQKSSNARKNKYGHWTEISPPKTILTSIEYRGSIDRKIINEDEHSVHPSPRPRTTRGGRKRR